jgi:hypothetical protein
MSANIEDELKRQFSELVGDLEGHASLDEYLNAKIAEGLRAEGVDVTASEIAASRGTDDADAETTGGAGGSVGPRDSGAVAESTIRAVVEGDADAAELDDDALAAGIKSVYADDDPDDYGTGIEGAGDTSMSPEEAYGIALADSRAAGSDDADEYPAGMSSEGGGSGDFRDALDTGSDDDLDDYGTGMADE